jgi:hypothetical protein
MNDQNLEVLRKERPAPVEQRDAESREAIVLLESAVRFLRHKEGSLKPTPKLPIDSTDHKYSALHTHSAVVTEDQDAEPGIAENNGPAISDQATPTAETASRASDSVISTIEQQIDDIFASQTIPEKNPLEGVL